MKRRLFWAMVAILAIGLAFIGCPTDSSSDDGPKPPVLSDFEKLTALTPTPITEPAGYKDFPEGIVDNTAFYVSAGEEGFIEDNGDGTYKVTIVTNPGHVSVISFQDEDYVYKTGFYLSLQLPTASKDSPHKPLGMTAFASTGPQENGSDWTSAQSVNITSDNKVDNKTKYLAGRVDFAWENEDNVWPRRTICLYIYWHDDEEDGAEYEFTVRKILVSDDDDLEPPAYPDTAWKPVSAGTAGNDWIDFPSEAVLAATYDIGEGPVSDCVTAVSDGYEITIPTRPGSNTQIIIPAAEGVAFDKGYYMLLDLPDNDPYLRPIRFYVATRNTATVWSYAVDYDASTQSPSSYVAGEDIGVYWTGTAASAQTGFYIQINWHPAEPEGTYTFTLKKLMITDDDIEIVDPDEPLVEWDGQEDPPSEPTSGYDDFLTGATVVYPAGGNSSINGSTVTVTTRANWDGKIVGDVYFNKADFIYTGGYFVLINLPDDSDLQVTGAMVWAGTDAFNDGIGWASQRAENAGAGKYMTGDVAFLWDGNEWNGATAAGPVDDIKIQLIFAPDTEVGEAYEFELDKLLAGGITVNPNLIFLWNFKEFGAPTGGTFGPTNAASKLNGRGIVTEAPVRMVNANVNTMTFDSTKGGFYMDGHFTNQAQVLLIGTDSVAPSTANTWNAADSEPNEDGTSPAGVFDFVTGNDNGIKVTLGVIFVADANGRNFTIQLNNSTNSSNNSPLNIPTSSAAGAQNRIGRWDAPKENPAENELPTEGTYGNGTITSIVFKPDRFNPNDNSQDTLSEGFIGIVNQGNDVAGATPAAWGAQLVITSIRVEYVDDP